MEAGRGTKLPLTPEDSGGVGTSAGRSAQASHGGSYAYCKEMRRSFYQRTFLKGSSLYREDMQRRPSTLPPHVQPVLQPQVPFHSLGVPLTLRQDSAARYPISRPSCSETVDHSTGGPPRRPYRSLADDFSCDFPLRIKKDLSAETFRRSLDSESSGSYMSPRSRRSNNVEELEMDVFSRQSSDASEELRKKRTNRILSFQESRKIESTDTTDETWKTCASAEQTIKSDTSSQPKLGECKKPSKESTISWETSIESDSSFGQSVIDVTKDIELKDLGGSDDLKEKGCERALSNKAKADFFKNSLLQWNKNYEDDYDTDNLAPSSDAAIEFKIDFYMDDSEHDPDSPIEINCGRSVFPKKKSLTGNVDLKPLQNEPDEGFDSPVFGNDTDELSDMRELSRRETFRRERSLDSDETSGFISKHSSETTDLSSRLSSTQFTTKHLSEPSDFGSKASAMPQQRLSEPHQLTALPEIHPKFGLHKLLSVDLESEPRTPGISKKREHFRKSKRLKHFNLRRIDDTDNDSSCDSEKPLPSSEEAAEPPSTRLKQEVGLPKHLSRDSSVDRYGLYKSRSEKTITSFESDRLGQARLQDFESFCEAVNFAPVLKVKAASADELDPSDTDGSPALRTPLRHLRRKSRSKRDLTRRLKCLLL